MSGEVKLEKHEEHPLRFVAKSPPGAEVEWAVLFAMERWPDSRTGGTLGHLSVYVNGSYNVARVTLTACEGYKETIPYAERIASALLAGALQDPEGWGAKFPEATKKDSNKWISRRRGPRTQS